jgi:hypothetical protein
MGGAVPVGFGVRVDRWERAATPPGDELINEPSFVTNHAATLPAPPAAVWPWLTQVGWHRVGR